MAVEGVTGLDAALVCIFFLSKIKPSQNHAEQHIILSILWEYQPPLRQRQQIQRLAEIGVNAGQTRTLPTSLMLGLGLAALIPLVLPLVSQPLMLGSAPVSQLLLQLGIPLGSLILILAFLEEIEKTTLDASILEALVWFDTYWKALSSDQVLDALLLSSPNRIIPYSD